jgi:pimeloyl-ACP methyl ester carboxylesterase
MTKTATDRRMSMPATTASICMAAACILAALLPLGPARAAERWETFLQPPPLPSAAMEGRVNHDGASIWFAVYGSGPPVILLHGGGASSDTFGFQVPALVGDGHRVIVIDSRGQGRSTNDGRPLGYELMESDVIAVMDALSVRKAAVVGWSDGAILGLIMAMKNPDRETRVFAFSPNMDTKGLRSDWTSKPIIAAIMTAAKAGYERVSPTPAGFDAMMTAVATMAATQPNYSAEELARIQGPAIAIVDADHEEFILPEHTRYLASTIPHAKLIILTDVSHMAPVQDPDQFNKAMITFLDGD